MRYLLASRRAQVDGPGVWARLACAAPVLLWLPRLAGPVFQGRAARRAEGWWAKRAVRALAIDLDARGFANIDPEASYVVVALHESAVDPVALLHLPLRLRFVVRAELLAWPYFGAWLRRAGHVPVRPEDGAAAYRALLDGARTAAASGESLVVFPQGTLLGIETEFQPGAFQAAARLGLPLLPVVLTGGHRVWEQPFTRRLRRGQRMSMRVLAPVSAAQLTEDGADATRLRLQAEMKDHAQAPGVPAPRQFDPVRDGFWDGYRYSIDPAFPELRDEIDAHRAAPVTPGR